MGNKRRTRRPSDLAFTIAGVALIATAAIPGTFSNADIGLLAIALVSALIGVFDRFRGN